jgi:hypothetical protein
MTASGKAIDETIDGGAIEFKADLLMKRYTLLKQEIFLLIGSYKAHVRNLQVYLTFAAGLLGFFLTKETYPPIISSWLFWTALSIFLTCLVGYMAFDILEAQYHMIAVAARMTSLEKIINRLAGENLLLWETKLSGMFFGGTEVTKGFWHPDWFLPFYLGVLMMFGTLAPPILGVLWFWLHPTGRVLPFLGLGAALAFAVATLCVVGIVAVKTTVIFRSQAQDLVGNIVDEAAKADPA